MMTHEILQSLVRLYGVETHYVDAWGKPSEVSETSQIKLLEAMGVDVSDSYTMQQAIDDEVNASWSQPFPPVIVVREHQALVLQGTFPIDLTNEVLTIRIHTEQGDNFDYRTAAVEGELTDVWHSSDKEYQKYHLVLESKVSEKIPVGYHQLTVESANMKSAVKLIVAPTTCYHAPAIEQGTKPWGFSVQLYALRSERNWGMGDFSDLKRLATHCAKLGADFIGLNPIHALFPSNPDVCSPYGPSSRRWLNCLYLDVSAIDGFEHDDVQAKVKEQGFVERLERARQLEYIDYNAVGDLKMPILEAIFTVYKQRFLSKNTKQNKVFKRFIARGDESLLVQCTYDALQQHFKLSNQGFDSWHSFPEPYRSFDSEAVQTFIKDHGKRVMFYQFLQWQASIQLEEAQQTALQAGMAIGLYRDLAVGVSEGSSEVWGNKALYCTKASVGAPPDVLGPLGQNWGLPPMNPTLLYQQAYQPVIDMFSANMASAGALRVDHVMALLRLWWIPHGEGATAGGYVYYPVDDLLAILALESHRNANMVIGEDLGTVPTEIRQKLSDNGIYSYRVFFFEQAPDGGFYSPEHYPKQSLATLTTHDMPTLIGFWHCHDFELGKQLGVYPDDEVLRGLYHDRHRQKQAILDTLHWHASVSEEVGKDVDTTGMTESLNHGLHLHMAKGSSTLLSFQLEDWLQMDKPVNIPGTFNEYPNWRRKLTVNIEDIFSNPTLLELGKSISHCRHESKE
jgi:4-alpha-glucanotransferase